MKKIFLILLLLTVFANISLAAVGISGRSAVLLPLGDSITFGTGDATGNLYGYRDHLQTLVGVGNYDFIGQFNTSIVSGIFDGAHSGIGSQFTYDIEARMSTELALFPGSSSTLKKVILLHVGTNDTKATQGNIDAAVQNVQDIFNLIYSSDPNIVVYTALIIPKTTDVTNTANYNTSLAAMIATYRSTHPNYHTVDMYTPFISDTTGLCAGNYATNCLSDTTHPNDTGSQVMARTWAKCLNNISSVGCDGN